MEVCGVVTTSGRRVSVSPAEVVVWVWTTKNGPHLGWKGSARYFQRSAQRPRLAFSVQHSALPLRTSGSLYPAETRPPAESRARGGSFLDFLPEQAGFRHHRVSSCQVLVLPRVRACAYVMHSRYSK